MRAARITDLPKKSVEFPHRLADMEADPDLDRQIGMGLAIGGEGPLQRDRAQDRPPDAGKGDHESVAEGLDLMPPVRRDLAAKDLVVGPDQFAPAQVAELVVKLRRSDDVGEHDRDRAVEGSKRPHLAVARQR